MKNKVDLLIVLAVMIFVIGCSCGGFDRFVSTEAPKEKPPVGDKTTTPGEGKTIEDKTIETVVGDETTGVPECDELLRFFQNEANSDQDNYLTKATKQFFFNKIKESFKEDFEKNKGNKEQMAKNCKDYLQQLKSFKANDANKAN